MNKKLNDATPSEWDRAARSGGSYDLTTEEGRQATWEQFANVGPEPWEQPDGYNTEQDEDMVNSPSHYTYGKVECIEGIEESMTPEAFKGYCKGACLKYLWRYERKDKPLEDLQKCQWYLNRLVDVVEAENNKRLAKANEISELVELIDYSELERLESKVGAAACKWNTACNNTELANASDHSYADYSKAVAHAAEELRAAVKALEDHDVGQYL